MRQGGDDGAAATSLERLAATVPPTAATVLQVGMGDGWLAAHLKQRQRPPTVYGVGAPTVSPSPDRSGLDDLFDVDVDNADVPVAPGSVDCIVYADALPRLADPLATLRRHRALLSPSGTVTCSVPNLQHHSIVRDVVRGVFPYAEGTLLDPAYRHLYTSAAVMQLLLDAGYAPDTVDRLTDDGDEAMAMAAAPLFEWLGVGAVDAERDLGTTTLIVRGVPLPDVGVEPEVPVTVVACVNDDAQLEANLARSPCLQAGRPHQLLVFRGCASAAEGLNAGIDQAEHEFVVFVHQDVYLPEQWPARLVSQWRRAESAGGPIGVAGVFGVLDRKVPFDAIGRVVHRDRLLSHRSLPADVDGLDELLMVVRRDTPLRVDPDLGWHLYGTDLALQAQRRHLRVVVVDAPCHHNSLTGRVPSKYRDSERVLARKWRDELPIHTNLSSMDRWLIEDGDDGGGPTGEAHHADARRADAPRADAPRADVTGASLSDAGASDVAGAPGAVADLVSRLRREQVALGTELEQARLQVASMKASPFWRAREAYVSVRRRLRGRR